jgi:hypothetical protein
MKTEFFLTTLMTMVTAISSSVKHDYKPLPAQYDRRIRHSMAVGLGTS